MHEFERSNLLIDVRNIEEGMVPQLAQVYMDAFNAADPKQHWTLERAINFLHWLIGNKSALCLVALDEDKPIGAVMGWIKPYWKGNVLTNTEVFVHPDYQGLEIASKLKAELDTLIPKHNIVSIEGLVNSAMEFPFKWYKNLGFNETGWIEMSKLTDKIE